MKSRLILVGGFLGAGKTTLLWEAAQRSSLRGLRVGLITNDQAPELVDTTLLSRGDLNVEEVSGSCFCCNFPGLLQAMGTLHSNTQADVLIAEPVGSCTDLSATIVQPLKDMSRQDWAVAPLSVLVDPFKLADILAGGVADLHPSAAYIFRKQLEEADFIVITKADLISSLDLEALVIRAKADYPLAKVMALSAQSGAGVDTWLDVVLESTEAGLRLAEVDYDIYAEGEAVLGWLNATYRLQGPPTHWYELTDNFLSALAVRFDDLQASVGHVKILVEAGGDFVVGNLTGKASTLRLRGTRVSGTFARLTLNARVEMSPETLATIVAEELDKLRDLTVTPLASRCLSPGRPEPTYRYAHLVAADAF